MNHYIATFYTHYGAIKFDKDCHKFGVSSKLMPVPRKLSSSCGTCVMFQSQSCNFIEPDEDLENCFIIVGKDLYDKIELLKKGE